MTNLDASTNYKIQVEYLTKYNTKGLSNLVEFNTSIIFNLINFKDLSWKKIFFLNILVEFYINVTSSRLIERQTGTLKCTTFDDTLISQIVWYKDDELLGSNNRFNISIDDVSKIITISNLSHLVHNGNYKCSAKLSINNQILNSTNFNLMVKCKFGLSELQKFIFFILILFVIHKDGPIFTNNYASQSDFRYNISDSAQFMCSSEGYGPFKFGWKYDYDETRALNVASNYSNETFKYFSILNFKNISRRDNGSYSCHVDSSIISTIRLFVPSIVFN